MNVLSADTVLSSLTDPMTYHPGRNGYLWVGFFLGLPVPLFFLWFNEIYDPVTFGNVLLDQPLHVIWLLYFPVLTIAFGVVGTVHHQLLEELEYRSTHDALTGLYNYRYFRERTETLLEESAQAGQSFGLVMLDIDHLKKVNTRHDHLAGSQVVKEMGLQILSGTRSNDEVCLYGGDEYVIIMPDTTLERAHKITERIRKNVEDHDFGVEVDVTISAGIGSFPEDGTSVNSLLRTADQRLARAKETGRNRVVARDEDE